MICSLSTNFGDREGSLLYHLSNAPVGEDVSCVDQPVKHLRCLLYEVTLVGVVLQLLICGTERREELI